MNVLESSLLFLFSPTFWLVSGILAHVSCFSGFLLLAAGIPHSPKQCSIGIYTDAWMKRLSPQIAGLFTSEHTSSGLRHVEQTRATKARMV